ncbi:MAG TPA: ribosome silencing factor [Cytophagales bacterium]|nr:ribosome silencing factor [Cytophagales bacterium]
MITNKDRNSEEELCEWIVKGMQEKKASDIVIINLKNIKNSIADYFIICSGNSDNQVDAITDSVEEVVYKGINQDPWHKEGKENKEWILLDYVNVVAHIFKKERREFYSLEDLWGDAAIVHVEDSKVEQSTF